MSLLTFELPEDRIQFLKDSIEKQKKELSDITSPRAKSETEARIAKLEQFLKLLEAESLTEGTILPMTNDGTQPGTSANINISIILGKSGSVEFIKDQELIAKLKKLAYKENVNESNKAIFNETHFPNIYEWWEKGDPKYGQIPRGIIRIP